VAASNTAGAVTSVSEMTGTVAAASAPTPTSTTQTITFSGSLTPKNGSRTFTVNVGAGTAHAGLSFSKCNSLVLGLSNGVSKAGPSVVTLDASLSAGMYIYTVSGGRCSFILTVTSPAP
jgi:hypothetical protein